MIAIATNDVADRVERKLKFGSNEDRRDISTDFTNEECRFLLFVLSEWFDAQTEPQPDPQENSTVAEKLRISSLE